MALLPVGRARARIRNTVAVLRRGGRGPILVSVAIGWLLVLGTRVVLPTLLPQVKAVFGFGDAAAGFLLTGLWGAYALMQFPAGLLSDRIGERGTLLLSVLITIAGALAIAAAPTLAVFVTGVVLFGIGAGLYAPPRVTVLSRIYPDRDNTALGVTFAVGSTGAAVLPVIAGGFAILFGWRFGFAFVIPMLVLVGLALWKFVPPSQDTAARMVPDEPQHLARRLAGAMTDRTVILVWLAMTLTLISYQGLAAFLPTYLIARKGVNQATAVALFGLFYASGAGAQSVAGGLADRYGARRVLVVLAAIGALTLGALPLVNGIIVLSLLVLLLGFRLGIGPVSNSYVVAILPNEVQGSGYGLFRTIYLGAGSLGSSFVGVLAGLGLFDEAFFALAAITGLAVGLYLLLPSPDQDGSTSPAARDSPSGAVESGSDAGEDPDDTTD